MAVNFNDTGTHFSFFFFYYLQELCFSRRHLGPWKVSEGLHQKLLLVWLLISRAGSCVVLNTNRVVSPLSIQEPQQQIMLKGLLPLWMRWLEKHLMWSSSPMSSRKFWINLISALIQTYLFLLGRSKWTFQWIWAAIIQTAIWRRHHWKTWQNCHITMRWPRCICFGPSIHATHRVINCQRKISQSHCRIAPCSNAKGSTAITSKCVVPENIHTSPGMFSSFHFHFPHPSSISSLALYFIFKILRLPSPLKRPVTILQVGMDFSGATH